MRGLAYALVFLLVLGGRARRSLRGRWFSVGSGRRVTACHYAAGAGLPACAPLRRKRNCNRHAPCWRARLGVLRSAFCFVCAANWVLAVAALLARGAACSNLQRPSACSARLLLACPMPSLVSPVSATTIVPTLCSLVLSHGPSRQTLSASGRLFPLPHLCTCSGHAPRCLLCGSFFSCLHCTLWQASCGTCFFVLSYHALPVPSHLPVLLSPAGLGSVTLRSFLLTFL